MRMNPQVLVVGAGPVGLTMAAELARYGIAVRIVDKAAERTDKSKALVLWSRTLELLDRAGASGAFVAAGLKVDAAAASGLLKDFPDLIEPTLRAPLVSGCLCLARPDGYVAAVAKETDASAIVDCLNRLARQ
jgi:threonine dehydrogenase-like Zn-dependent dehydrogenase